MKKILSMLAFVATIVLSVFAFASCGEDGEIDPYKVKHKYSPVAEIITSKSDWKGTAAIESKKLTSEITTKFKFKEEVMNRTDASFYWMSDVNGNAELSKAMQAAADEYGKQADDTSLKCVFKLMEDGKDEFRSKEWLTRFLFNGAFGPF